MKKNKVLWVVNAYPTKKNPGFGRFIESQYDSLDGIQKDIVVIQGGKFAKYFIGIFLILRKTDDYDIIHCHHYLSAVLVSALLRIRLIDRPKLLVLSLQNDYTLESIPIFRKYIQRNFKFIVKSKSGSTGLSNYSVIPNGVDTSFFVPGDITKKKSLDLKLLFVSAGGIRKQKRIDRFHKVIELLSNDFNVIPIIITHANAEEMREYYQSSDALICTSDFEGSSNAVKEALSCNCKVFSTPVGDIQKILGKKSSKYVSDSFSVASLYSLIKLNIMVEDDFQACIRSNDLEISQIAKKIVGFYEENIF